MVELLTYIATRLAFLFSRDGYRFVDSRVETDAGGDAMVILESPVLRLRLTRDRSQLLLEFQPIGGKRSEWFSPGLLQGWLTGQRPSSEVLDEEWARFLAASLPRLEERLKNSELTEETLGELRRQAKLRAKELFG